MLSTFPATIWEAAANLLLNFAGATRRGTSHLHERGHDIVRQTPEPIPAEISNYLVAEAKQHSIQRKATVLSRCLQRISRTSINHCDGAYDCGTVRMGQCPCKLYSQSISELDTYRNPLSAFVAIRPAILGLFRRSIVFSTRSCFFYM
jgi:hypothetical protein